MIYYNNIESIKCKNCSKKFKPKVSFQVYCSKKCSKDYCKHKQRKIQKEAFLSGNYTTLTPYYKLRFEILKRDNFTCQYCGRKSPDTILHIDHITPKSKGGKFNKSNLITSCIYCNLGKTDILLTIHQEEYFKNKIKF